MKISDADFIRLRDFMYHKFGINLAQKRILIEGRLSMTLTKRGYTDFGPYIDDVMRDLTGKEVSLLVSKLTTNFTFFLREEGHYHFLAKQVFPSWKNDKIGANRKIWSAACSSGEEPYSLAMAISNFFGMQAAHIGIDASDISQNVLDTAKTGVYDGERISKLPKDWVIKYFTKKGEDEYEVKPTLKAMIQYRYFNLNDPLRWPFRTYDIIFCRNVMIYFDQVTRQALSKRLFDALKPGGYLIVGMSETLVNLKTDFKYVQPSVYRREV
ncbi:MAG: protein-glutamate O-methyltransferase CheR [Candidatus Pelethousia sp.]|nr:protein-glutamate O-methyltransferase CheR [Candidatus Pelethousia sp.]